MYKKYSSKKEELYFIVEAFKKDYEIYKSSNTSFNEQMTRQQYLDRLLRLLGWDISNPKNLSFNNREIVAEEYSNRYDKPDYTIRINGSSLFYVEAKKVSISIESDVESALQVRRYGWNSGHKIAVLTNFEYLAIYTTYHQPKEGDTASKFRYKLYHYSEFIEKFDEIYRLLSRNSVINGEFNKWTNKITPEDATKLSLDKVFLEQLNKWRLMVANDLISTSIVEFQDLNYLNECTQIFLNQLIFMRFAEDNNLEKMEELKKRINQHTDYKSYFNTLDRKYNSGIFENPDIILNINENTLEEIVENLYFPNVSYDFSIIDLSILSRIYENFLQMEIVFDENKNIKLEKTKSAKIKAVVSTPNSVVKLMVNKALKNKIKDLSPDEILKLRIGDLAVGSGIFFIESYNFIENYLVDWYAKENNIAPTPTLVPFELKKKIIQDVFRGFDINNQAVQLTRFSLLLRLLSYENKERIVEIAPILPSLKDTIICGNSLINEQDINITKVSYEKIIEIAPMRDNVFEELKFDIIIGNPPYLQTKEILESTPKEEIEVYKLKYDSSYKQYDKYFLFIERTLKLLKKDGTAVLLVPNKFFTVGAATRLRELIKEKKGLSFIIDFKTTQLFNSVINYVAIVDFGEFSNSKFKYAVADSIEKAFSIEDGILYDINKLETSHWFLTSHEKLLQQYEFAVRQFPNVETAVTPVNGIQTSANAIFLIDKKELIGEDDTSMIFEVRKENRKEQFSIEKTLLKDFYQTPSKVQGKSYMPLVAEKYVIFPYNNGKIINSKNMESNYPNTKKYLEKDKKALLPKSMGGKRDVQYVTEWYQYGRTQFLKESTVDKILVGVMSNQPNFNIDRKKMLFASGGTAGYIALMKKDGSPYSLEYIQAWLSHPFTDMIFQTIGSSFEGDFYTHGTAMYKDVPLLPIDFSSSYEHDKYSEIVKNVKEIEKLNVQIISVVIKYKQDFIERKKQAHIRNINNIFDELLEYKMVNNNE